MGWTTILGLVDPGTPEWSRVRAEQINTISDFALVRLAFSVLAGCIVVATLAQSTSLLMLLGWFGVVVLVSGVLALPHIGKRASPKITATVTDLHVETLSLAVAGLAWTALPFALGLGGQREPMLTVWTVGTALMGCVAFAFSAAPLAAGAFIMIMGAGLAWMTYQIGLPLIALTAGAYAVALTAASLINGKTIIMHRFGQFGWDRKL